MLESMPSLFPDRGRSMSRGKARAGEDSSPVRPRKGPPVSRMKTTAGPVGSRPSFKKDVAKSPTISANKARGPGKEKAQPAPSPPASLQKSASRKPKGDGMRVRASSGDALSLKPRSLDDDERPRTTTTTRNLDDDERPRATRTTTRSLADDDLGIPRVSGTPSSTPGGPRRLRAVQSVFFRGADSPASMGLPSPAESPRWGRGTTWSPSIALIRGKSKKRDGPPGLGPRSDSTPSSSRSTSNVQTELIAMELELQTLRKHLEDALEARAEAECARKEAEATVQDLQAKVKEKEEKERETESQLATAAAEHVAVAEMQARLDAVTKRLEEMEESMKVEAERWQQEKEMLEYHVREKEFLVEELERRINDEQSKIESLQQDSVERERSDMRLQMLMAEYAETKMKLKDSEEALARSISPEELEKQKAAWVEHVSRMKKEHDSFWEWMLEQTGEGHVFDGSETPSDMSEKSSASPAFMASPSPGWRLGPPPKARYASVASPDNDFGGRVRQDGFGGGVRQDGFGGGVRQDGFGGVRQDGFGGGVRQDDLWGKVRQDTFGGRGVRHDYYGGRLRQDSFAGRVRQDDFGGKVRQSSHQNGLESPAGPEQPNLAAVVLRKRLEDLQERKAALEKKSASNGKAFGSSVTAADRAWGYLHRLKEEPED